MNKLEMKTTDIVNVNIKYIKDRFPNAIVETEKGFEVDFNTLKQEMSNIIADDTKEKYQLTWPGKKEAILLANTRTTKTLRPLKEKSVDFDNTENIYIEGDNLETLKILQESYLNKIKCIYIDPPYNTGNDFIYNDNFNKNTNEELEDSGQVDEEGNRLITNYESSGKYHSNWISNIYPRLKLSRNLLTDDGIIFISIDDNELCNLKKMCDEIFGEYNFVCNFIRKTSFGEKTAKPNINKHHDYVLCYAKKINVVQSKEVLNGEQKEFTNYSNPDNDPNGPWTKDSYLIKIDNGRYGFARYAITNPYLNITHYPPVYYDENNRKQWHYIEETFREMEKRGQVVYYKDKSEYNGEYSFFIKKYKKDVEKTNSNISTLAFDNNSFVNAIGTKDIINVFDDKEFNNSYPKPVELVKKIIQYSNWNSSNSIILDFFSGSATTAEAVLKYNVENNTKHRFILIQVPERCNEKSKYLNICELGEERIRRAGKKIKEETNANIDYGFRVYKVDSSNMKDVYYKPNDLEQAQLNLFETNVKEDRTNEDLLTQIILDLGLTLDLKIEEKNILSNKVYYVAENSLVACFDKNIGINIVDEICKCKPLKIVFKEECFNTDNLKINVQEKIKKLSPESEVYVL